MDVIVQNRIDQDWLDANKNEKAEQPFFDRYCDYVDKSMGSLRTWSLVRNFSKLRNAVGFPHSELASHLEKTASTAISGLGLVRLPRATAEAYEALSNLGENDGVSIERKTGIAIRDAMEAITSWCNASGFVTANTAFGQVAKITDLGSDTADLCLSVNDYYLASNYEDAALGDVKEAFAHTRKYYMLRAAKAVLSVAAAVFAVVFMIFTGVKVLPLILAIFLSLATTFIAIGRDLFKEMGTYKLIDLKRPIL